MQEHGAPGSIPTDLRTAVAADEQSSSAADMRAFTYMRETLLAGIPEEKRESAAREYVAGLVDVFRVHGTAIPEWLAAVAGAPLPDCAR